MATHPVDPDMLIGSVTRLPMAMLLLDPEKKPIDVVVAAVTLFPLAIHEGENEIWMPVAPVVCTMLLATTV